MAGRAELAGRSPWCGSDGPSSGQFEIRLGRLPGQRIFRALLGPHARGPVGILWAFRIRMDDTLEEYTAVAQRYPLFELRPMDEASG
jgi:hypothetical protein